MKKKTNFPSYLEKDYWFFLLHDFYPIFSGSIAVCLPNLSYACWPISIKLDKRDQVSKDSKFLKPTAHLPPPGSMGRGTSSGQRLHKLQGPAGALTKLPGLKGGFGLDLGEGMPGTGLGREDGWASCIYKINGSVRVGKVM